jgi:hypothetical protein
MCYKSRTSSRALDTTDDHSRDQVQGETSFDTDPAVTPVRTMVRGLGMAVLLAAGAFVLTMLKDPPQSVASDPTAPVTETVDVQVPTGLPALDFDCLFAIATCQ